MANLEPEYIWQAFFRWQEIDNFGSASGNFGIRRCAFHKSVKITLSTPNLGTTTSGNPLICDLEDYPTMSIRVGGR